MIRQSGWLVAIFASLLCICCSAPISEPSSSSSEDLHDATAYTFSAAGCGAESFVVRKTQAVLHEFFVSQISQRRFDFEKRLVVCKEELCVGSAVSKLSANRSRFVTSETLNGIVVAFARCPNPPEEAYFCNVTVQREVGAIAFGALPYRSDRNLAETMLCISNLP